MTRKQALFAADHDWYVRTIITPDRRPFETDYATVVVRELMRDENGQIVEAIHHIRNFSSLLAWAGY